MNFFVIADVHGCLFTLQKLLRHWRPQDEMLVQLGDLVDRGNHSPEVVELCRRLSQEFPDRTVFLQGNHDWAMAEHVGLNGPFSPWLSWGGRGTLHQYGQRRQLLAAHAVWLGHRPLHWQNEHVLFSHAGFADVAAPLDPTSSEGVLWRRGPLRNTGQLQVVGHTTTTSRQPEHDKASNTIYLDTGAGHGLNLTGLRLSETGQVLEIVSVPVSPEDMYSFAKLI